MPRLRDLLSVHPPTNPARSKQLTSKQVVCEFGKSTLSSVERESGGTDGRTEARARAMKSGMSGRKRKCNGSREGWCFWLFFLPRGLRRLGFLFLFLFGGFAGLWGGEVEPRCVENRRQ